MSETYQFQIKSWVSSVGAGSFAGAMGILVGHPFDTLKTRMQVGKGFKITSSPVNMFKQLYRGILPPLCTSGIMQSINFSGYEACKRTIYPILMQRHQVDIINSYHNQHLHLLTVFISGAISGSIISVLASPISLIKVQQQVAVKVGVIECANLLYTKYGFMRFYRGYCAMFIMESYGRGVYLATYEGTKMIYPSILNTIQTTMNNTFSSNISPTISSSSTSTDNNNNKNDLISSSLVPSSSSSSSSLSTSTSTGAHSTEYTQTSLLVRMCSAATAGCCSWFSIYPFDVVKSRMQLDIDAIKFKDCTDCFMKTWSEGGIRLMFRGLKYTLIRAAPVAATILPIYEFTKERIDEYLYLYLTIE